MCCSPRRKEVYPCVDARRSALYLAFNMEGNTAVGQCSDEPRLGNASGDDEPSLYDET